MWKYKFVSIEGGSNEEKTEQRHQGPQENDLHQSDEDNWGKHARLL